MNYLKSKMHGLPMTMLVSEDCSSIVLKPDLAVERRGVGGGGAGASGQVLVLFHGPAPLFDALCS